MLAHWEGQVLDAFVRMLLKTDADGRRQIAERLRPLLLDDASDLQPISGSYRDEFHIEKGK